MLKNYCNLFFATFPLCGGSVVHSLGAVTLKSNQNKPFNLEKKPHIQPTIKASSGKNCWEVEVISENNCLEPDSIYKKIKRIPKSVISDIRTFPEMVGGMLDFSSDHPSQVMLCCGALYLLTNSLGLWPLVSVVGLNFLRNNLRFNEWIKSDFLDQSDLMRYQWSTPWDLKIQNQGDRDRDLQINIDQLKKSWDPIADIFGATHALKDKYCKIFNNAIENTFLDPGVKTKKGAITKIEDVYYHVVKSRFNRYDFAWEKAGQIFYVKGYDRDLRDVNAYASQWNNGHMTYSKKTWYSPRYYWDYEAKTYR